MKTRNASASLLGMRRALPDASVSMRRSTHLTRRFSKSSGRRIDSVKLTDYFSPSLVG